MAYIRFLDNVKLDNTYNNPIYFSGGSGKPINLPSGLSQISYNDFFSVYDASWDIKGTPVNFSFGDGINTSLVVSSTYFKPSNNYAIVILDDNDINISSGRYKPTKYFYFVTSFAIYGKNNYRVELELDVMTTFLPSLQIGTDVFVERKHCNRWNDTPTLNFKDAILGDALDGSFKASVPSKVVYPKYKSINETSVVSGKYDLVNDWINSKMWVYLFFTQTPKGNYTTFNPTELNYSRSGNIVKSGVYCVSFPCSIMKVKDFNGNYIDYGVQTAYFYDLIQYPSCIGAKLSFRSPFYSDYPNKIDFSNNTIYLDFNYTTVNNVAGSRVYRAFNGNMEFYFVEKNAKQQEDTDGNPQYFGYLTIASIGSSFVESDYIDIYGELGIGTGIDFDVNIDKIVERDKKYEPKLFCNPYYNLVLSSQFGSYYNYNPLLFDTPNVKVVYYCTITPEPDKIYTYIKTEKETSPYFLQKDLNIGSVVINDNNIPYRQDAYAEYLSTHRASVITSLAVPVAQAGKNFVSTLAKSPSVSAYNYGVDVVSTAVQWYSNIVDLQNTPDTIKNLGNNPIHDFVMDNNNKPYIVAYKLFENEENQVYQYYYDNGYCINRENTFDLHNFNKESILTRRLFNYVKLNENIVSKMSFDLGGLRGIYYVPQTIKNKINNILNRGCKIWTLIKNDTNTDNMLRYYLTNEFENSEIIM